MNHVGMLIGILFFFLDISQVVSAEMVQPNPEIAPAEVVAIQLNGLKYNDTPDADAGIRQAWAFAHPRNQLATGPLSQFSIMLKGPGYGMMLNHHSHKILPAQFGKGWRQFDVVMESEIGNFMKFTWIVEKVNYGRYKDCWMTVAVSAPQLSGQES
jgi:hypothetical protein